MASAFPFSDAAMNQPQPPGVILSTGHPSLVHAEHSEESKELDENSGEKGTESPLRRGQEADQWSEKDDVDDNAQRQSAWCALDASGDTKK